MYLVRVIFIIFFGIKFAGTASAEIAWDKTSISVEAQPGQKEVEAAFTFANNGKKAVTITQVEVACDCTGVTYDKSAIEPESEGQIRMKFTIGDRRGVQRKHLWVTLSDQPNRRHQLTLAVDIPILMEIRPRVLYWRVEDPLEEKEIAIEISSQHKVKIKVPPLKSTSNFTCEWSPTEVGGQLSVRPKSLKQPMREEVVLQAELPSGYAEDFSLFLLVR